MPIQAAQSPEGMQFYAVGVNKFLGRGDHRDCEEGHVGLCGPEGHRGLLLARHTSGKEAVVLALTTSLSPGDGVRWGRLYLIREDRDDQYPRLVKRITMVPDGAEWDLQPAASAGAGPARPSPPPDTACRPDT